MANINIADFKRPGIFIREIDASVRQIPAQTELINLVAGFSRKGSVNKPIFITTPQQFIEIFGDVDRLMEKRGCFFHRSVLNILRNGPVWALNLLKTDDTLDVIDWQTISIASNVPNSVVKQAPYSSFFDRADFWERDTDSFLTYANDHLDDNRQVMHITNMSDKKVSVFVYKANVEGYNDTLDIFYSGVNNVPLYLDPKDQAKDYIVSMLIVQGDWSDYNTLSVDSRWGKYFNKKGLVKGQIGNFSNDPAVNVLKFYSDLSIIPYFKDTNGRDVFIETVVNRDTDTHGVFLTFDIDKVESAEYRTGLLDLIGSNLVDDPTSVIDYLSYYETITENIPYFSVVLDRQGNAFGKNLEYEMKYSGTPTFIQTIGAGSTEIELTGITSYNLNSQAVVLDSSSATVDVVNVNIGKIRKDTIYLDDNGAVGVVQGFEVSNQTVWANVPLKPVASGLLPIGIVGVGEQATSGSAVGLGIEYINAIPNVKWGVGAFETVINVIVTPVSLGSTCGTSGTAFCGFTNSTSFNAVNLVNDIAITYNGINEVKFTFTSTKSSDPDTNYRKTILNKIFGDVQSNLKTGLSIIKDNVGNKVTINNVAFVTDGSSDKSFTINVSPSININRNVDAQVIYIDDEQQFTPTSGYISLGLRTNPLSSTTGSGYGIASIQSAIYKAFDNGIINSGDYFYPNLFAYKFAKVDFYSLAGNDYITLWYNSGDIDAAKLFTNRKIKVFGTTANDNIFTILNNGGEIGSQPGTYDTRLDLIVNENITTESITTGSITISGASETDKRYLKMYFIGSALYVDFTQDATLVGVNGLDTTEYDLSDIRIFSDIGSFKQTLEIESVLETNKILVNAARYGEVKIGDYLQAYVDTSSLRVGEVPKRLTRIIDKRAYAGDPTLTQLQTDAAIDIISFGTDKQTYRYTTIEDYVNTYKSITLGGFKMREDSLPNGTEQRQSDILNILAVNTPIFKGLVNRNKISWRYLIDCWGLGLTSNSKQQFVDLCGEKLTALGLLNMPSAKSFKKSTSPSFIDQDTKALNTAFIRQGGDPASNPSFLYTFADGKGQSNVAYFFPYVTISDNSRPLDMPPASFVCNTFMRKHTTRLASVKPWTVAAGINDGLITGIGNVEIDLTPTDIENLNLMNANPIVYKMNRGFVIETDNTAQVSPRSSLSYTHAREVLIELENELYEMLLTYQWRFNTKEVREEIKANADKICERYVKENGLYAFVNVMDESNNTLDIIDAQIGVLDTYVEIIKAMGIIVNNITVLKTGDIAAGGFQNIGG
ncbi:MAG: Tenacibaculum phage PTm1 [Bacteroidota bacterium]|jgi:hypothetical protein